MCLIFAVLRFSVRGVSYFLVMLKFISTRSIRKARQSELCGVSYEGSYTAVRTSAT